MSYKALLELPRINNVTLIDNLTLRQLGFTPLGNSINELILEVFGYIF